MHFHSFHIKNFKGIKDAKIELQPSGADVFTLIGLNESGKTTILEAISSFTTIKEDTDALYSGAAKQEANPASFVPKHLKANFSDSVTVTATLTFDEGEIEDIINAVEEKTGAKARKDSFPEQIILTRGYRFENSDLVKEIYKYEHPLSFRGFSSSRSKTEKVFPQNSDARKAILSEIRDRTPRIVYFPTFLFDQPERIRLNKGNKESAVNKHYRNIIENVAASLDNPLDIQKHIVERILPSSENGESQDTISSDKQDQITATLDKMSAHITDTIFGSWVKIFKGDFANRHIVFKNPGVETDPVTNEKFVYLQFAVKDGQTTYNITERSLGFRWFFSFLLFTMYRTKDGEKKPTLFLLDEPAANLHSGAQTQLLDSFPRIAKNGSQIIYSTHSHYMIEPTWLDQAYIVANSGVDYSRIDEGDKTVSNRPTDISAEKYRTFVGQNPDKETYFQPVLDRLKVTPSRLDLIKKSVLVEGKGDYFILEYGRKVILNSTNSVSIVPTKGADGMDDLIGLFMGWNVNFLICLDDDKPGQKARTKYIHEWGLADNMVVTLQAVHSSLSGKTIEGFLSTDDLKLISLSYGIKDAPSKSQIQLFFSEKLAKKEKVGMSKTFEEKISALEQLLAARFPSDNSLRD